MDHRSILIPNWLFDLLDQIEDQLTNDISLESLAKNIGYSVRHLLRQFKTLTKENLGDYIRGRRLSMAMADVMSSDQAILDIALNYGFESQEAFTRAFQARFMFPPRRFRLQKIHNPITLKTKIDAQHLQFIHSGSMALEPTVTTLGSMIFVGIGTRVDQNSFQKMEWLDALFSVFNELGEVKFPSANASPSSYLINYRESKVNPDDCAGIHMLAAKQFNEEIIVPESCERFCTPGGLYAVFHFEGPMELLMQRSNYILGTWLPQSGFWLGNGPAIVELKMDVTTNILTAKPCIPLRRRKTKTCDPWWELSS